MIEKLLAVGKPVWIVSVDLPKAFDRVSVSETCMPKRQSFQGAGRHKKPYIHFTFFFFSVNEINSPN